MKEESPLIKSGPRKTKKKPEPAAAPGNALNKLVINSINDLAEEDGWVFLGSLGNHIIKKEPSFDPRNYGFKKLFDIIKNIPGIEIQERASGKGGIAHLYVRIK